jgi:transcriptional regulator with XRE-family HTH domain
LFTLGVKKMTHPNPQQLADRLRQAREAAGLSIEQAACSLHRGDLDFYSGRFIESVEAAEFKPTSMELAILARLYGCSVSQLVSEPIDLDGLTPIEAFNRALITEGHLAELLGVSRLDARRMVLEDGKPNA